MNPELRDAVAFVRDYVAPVEAQQVAKATFPRTLYLRNTTNLGEEQLPPLLRRLHLQMRNGDGLADFHALFAAAWGGNLPGLGGEVRDVGSLAHPVRVVTPRLTIDVMELSPSHLLQLLAAPRGILGEINSRAGHAGVSPATLQHTRVRVRTQLDAYVLEAFCWCEVDGTKPAATPNGSGSR